MKISDKGLELLKQFEGFREKAYQVTPFEIEKNIWTIGYGSTFVIDKKGNRIPVTKGMTITKEDAEKALRSIVSEFEKGILRLVKVPLTQNQFDALVSFVYNVGLTQFKTSTLLKLLNYENYKEAAKQFPLWCRSGKQIIAGLQARRKEERALFEGRKEFA